jgi:hypothetical protein
MWVKFKPCFKFKQVLHIPPHPQAVVLNLWIDTLSGGTGHEIFLFKVLPTFSHISHASVLKPGSSVLPAAKSKMSTALNKHVRVSLCVTLRVEIQVGRKGPVAFLTNT